MSDLFAASPPAMPGEQPARQVWKVSELTRRIKGTLEGAFGSVWVEGEISNLRRPASGHAYFTLKDATSQLRAVMFRSALAGVSLPLKDGLQVRGYGQITVYEAAGDYQIVLRKLEAAGEGELMLRLEALKKKLAAEGLFALERKRPLPALPQHVGVVTSPTGAAIRDILQVLKRRFGNLHVVVAPVRVQGAGAAEEIAAAIDLLNERGGLDVLIVGRGGGSLEDLWCFNEEIVVRAIVRSRIPVISAVGHEIDWTLSDLAADVRAPTPSAAAEMVVKSKAELERRVADAARRLGLGAQAAVLAWRNRLDRAARTPILRDPLQVVRQRQQTVDYLGVRLHNALAGLPQLVRQRAETSAHRMELAMRLRLAESSRALQHAQAQLRLLNPKAVLTRGYSLTRLPDGRLLRAASEVQPGMILKTELAAGAVLSTVTATEGETHDGKNSQNTKLRGRTGAPGKNRGGDGKRQTRSGENGGGVRGGPEAGQTLLF
ncbi:MAG TPA: exodeoxyribonuclease VII large subunit [Kiritimatiellia bacterium]|nr:exodeoxyribonuclease VII large subunit [Kiritimatiellia bacterium]HOR73877.1 exodeoxyribonuclease VII large subunit [Kiritimatiellia bacterium]HOU58449.1 exodeoxyribonuclease VII large subunit [Kiritimatiellia bacterium]HPV46476.1 exodeoxyribonuclease VII large subunit [Kiritimatiellia bacterium]HPY62016.1 exodeoxyribonuclease VII large subunit [Kiritimatiellia bacterium]